MLAGPLVFTLISLVFTFIKTGYEDFIESRREHWVLKDTVEEVKEYIEQLKAFKKDLEKNARYSLRLHELTVVHIDPKPQRGSLTLASNQDFVSFAEFRNFLCF